MAQLALHHVNVIVTDLPRSLAFYQKLFGLAIIERPPFKSVGAWLVMVRRNGLAGFPQLFLLDPDRNIIEINGAP